MKVLIDTNVILDFFLARAPLYEAAKDIFKLISQDEISAFATASSITDIYYIAAKRLGDHAAREILRNLFSLLVIITVDGDDCAQALDLPVRDFEDALVTTCASKIDIDYIITNDAYFLKIDTSLAHVVTPADFLEL